MKRECPLVCLSLLIAAVQLLPGADVTPPAQATSTQSADFAPGGTVRIDASYDDLYVEGWDQPRVEVVVRKFMPIGYDAAHPEHAAKNLESINVALESRSPTELAITTTRPPQPALLRHLEPWPMTNHVRIEYEIHVPAASKLAIRHLVGQLSVTGVTGDIEANCQRGDIVLWLPAAGQYSVDARAKMGKISSDLDGASRDSLLVGQKFATANSQASQKVHLRVAFGGIAVKLTPKESGNSQ